MENNYDNFKRELAEAFSEENLRNLLNSKDKYDSSIAERFLGEVKLPDNYWEMPDAYYPGMFSESVLSETVSSFATDDIKIKMTNTANDRVIEEEGWEKEVYNSLEYHNPKSFSFSIIPEKQIIQIKQSDNSYIDIPFGLICGILLKCRELNFSKPESLKKAGKTRIEKED